MNLPSQPSAAAIRHPPSAIRNPLIALVGNPNTGKTTLFNALAGMRQKTGNYPGVTVETKKGRLRHGEQTVELVDLPGTYSLAPRSPDEMVAVNLILGRQQGEGRPDVVVTIVDASNLERNLYLTTQVLELGVPVVVALNMIDVAQGQGIRIDCERLAGQLGVPVVPIQANKRKGLDGLRQAILAAAGASPPAKTPPFPEAFEREAEALRAAIGAEVPVYLVRRLLLDVGGHTERLLAAGRDGLSDKVKAARKRLAESGCPVPAVEARVRYGWIREATAGCVERPAERPILWTDSLDRVLTHKVWGTLIFLAVMFLVFQSIFTWAKPLMDGISEGRGALAGLVGGLMDPGPLRSLIVDGVIWGVGSVLMFLPQILILFAFVAVLEDCGYMARAAFLMDRLMSRCGLNGKAFIPLLSSVACAVPGIMAARVIENRRDRLATILVAPLMSCSARLPVYVLLIGAFLSTDYGFAWWVPGVTLFAMYAIGLVVAPLVALVLKSTLLRGETPAFVMEMPLYKRPSLRTVLLRMSGSAGMFVRRAGTVILASMILVWALLYFPVTDPSHPEGFGFDRQIEELEDSIKNQREELARLKEPVADELRELRQLERKEKAKTLTDEDRQRRAVLEKELAPVKAKMKPFEEKVEKVEPEINKLYERWKGQSLLGRVGKSIEPVVEPLGWDWRLGSAALASFPAREVVVGTMGMLFSQGKGDAGDDEFRASLGDAMREVRWEGSGRELFTVPVALSVMVFFALCCQCASTLAVIRRETNSWGWPLLTFVYMTVLAYVGALLVYQVGTWLGG
ncbi:MAG: ferrous iron transport protein B [Gemmataceae bacterium]|nr:ferrous iron transport protein B [Gemmataceae bacterium]